MAENSVITQLYRRRNFIKLAAYLLIILGAYSYATGTQGEVIAEESGPLAAGETVELEALLTAGDDLRYSVVASRVPIDHYADVSFVIEATVDGTKLLALEERYSRKMVAGDDNGRFNAPPTVEGNFGSSEHFQVERDGTYTAKAYIKSTDIEKQRITVAIRRFSPYLPYFGVVLFMGVALLIFSFGLAWAYRNQQRYVVPYDPNEPSTPNDESFEG